MTSLNQGLNVFRAAGEETRLRILILLARGELTVTEITRILAQSQPRVSRHLKILADANLVERYQEGAWVFYRLARHNTAYRYVAQALETLNACDDMILARDLDFLDQIRTERAAIASKYFQENAAQWSTLRQLHLPDSDIEAAICDIIGPHKIDRFIDLGTGTGQMLILFADLYREAIGYDLSREMLLFARDRLEKDNIQHAQVRLADLFSLPMEEATADLVCLHQVLHFLADPSKAVLQAAKLLRPMGRMLIVDFASHELEFLREQHAHRRLGFSQQEVRDWCANANLEIIRVDQLVPETKKSNNLTVNIWLLTYKHRHLSQAQQKAQVDG